MKGEISRKHINYNFLKKIVARFDFDGVSDFELERSLPEISSILKDNGYNRRIEEFSNGVELDNSDPETIEISEIGLKNIKEQRIIVFKNDQSNIMLKLSSSYVFVSIQKTKYIDCLEYCEVLLRIMNVIRKNAIFFSGRRFGLRKVNQCFLMDINMLNLFFEKNYFNVINFKKSSNHKITQIKDCFNFEGYNINLIRTINSGEINGDVAHQVNLDTDSYVLGDDAVVKLIDDKTQIIEMNEMLFDLYKDVLTEEFLIQLKDGTFNEGVIKGIVENE